MLSHRADAEDDSIAARELDGCDRKGDVWQGKSHLVRATKPVLVQLMTRWRDEGGDVVAQYRVDMASKCAVDGQSLQVDAIKHQV